MGMSWMDKFHLLVANITFKEKLYLAFWLDSIIYRGSTLLKHV